MSEAYWAVERERTVTAYLIGLRGAGENVRAAVNSLHRGIPADAQRVQEHPETWRWLEARHWITFVVDRSKQWIYVTVVESATVI